MILLNTLLVEQQQNFRKSIMSYQKIVFLVANNQLKANDDKCHLGLSSREENAAIQIKNYTIRNTY